LLEAGGGKTCGGWRVAGGANIYKLGAILKEMWRVACGGWRERLKAWGLHLFKEMWRVACGEWREHLNILV